MTMKCEDALISSWKGDFSVIKWWILQQPDKAAAMAALNDEAVLANATKEGATKALDWWWAYTGSRLPDPASFKTIANAALLGHSVVAVVEWWWTRFLDHRTPEHTFGRGVPEVGHLSCDIDFFVKNKTKQRASAKVCPLPTNPYNQVDSAVRSAPMTRLHPEPLVPDLSPSAGCCCC
ncbi:hypothetical protein BC828DRAFT_399162 [Blastocladiella britannica]|nr:hypothetical protein BC828DRAFT_399162 [Blastocladiella britannica]